MEFKKPKAKKNSLAEKEPFVCPKDFSLVGIFNGLQVIVADKDAIQWLHNQGNFGKGTLSKGCPNYNAIKDDIPKIIFEQQYNSEIKWNAKLCTSSSNISGVDKKYELSCSSVNKFLRSVLINEQENEDSWKSWKIKTSEKLSDTHSKKSCDLNKNKFSTIFECNKDESTKVDENLQKMTESILLSPKIIEMSKPVEYFQEKVIVVHLDTDLNFSDISCEKIQARLETRPHPIVENLELSLEESFFLNFALKCLKIVNKNNVEINTNELWHIFSESQTNFFERYIIYHYYRSKGWVVKSGLKYGGDYLLYNEGPSYFHASYLIKILKSEKIMNWKEFLAINRLIETFNKDVVFCTVMKGNQFNEKTCFPKCLENCRVQEIMSRRWFPSKERILKTDIL